MNFSIQFPNQLAHLLQVTTSFYMLGVIWIVQLILYPSFLSTDPKLFEKLHARHTAAMGFLVGPAMILELITASLLIAVELNTFALTNLIIVILLWILTFFISVPLHNRLVNGFDEKTTKKLISTNWPRTALWSMKAIGTLYWINFL